MHTACQPTLQHHNSDTRTENHRQWNAVWPPDDGRKDARNMLRNKWLPIKSLIVASSWSRFYLLSMVQVPSTEVLPKVLKKFPQIFWKPMVQYRGQRNLPLVHILAQIITVHGFPSSSSRKILILSPHICIAIQVVSFFQLSPLRPYIYFSCLPYVPHASPISTTLIWSPWYYFYLIYLSYTYYIKRKLNY